MIHVEVFPPADVPDDFIVGATYEAVIYTLVNYVGRRRRCQCLRVEKNVTYSVMSTSAFTLRQRFKHDVQYHVNRYNYSRFTSCPFSRQEILAKHLLPGSKTMVWRS